MNVRIKLTSQSLCEGMEITHPKHLSMRDFPGGPVFENLLCDAEDMGLTPVKDFQMYTVSVRIKLTLQSLEMR